MAKVYKAPSMKIVKNTSKHYDDRPTLTLTAENFPGIKDLKVNEKVTLCIECTVDELGMREKSYGLSMKENSKAEAIPAKEPYARIRITKMGQSK